jgi:raffinose/stachyose/melibiose transport system substrate-binding protein
MTRKRLFVYGLLALLILAFVACSGAAAPTEEAEIEEEAPEVEEEMPAADVTGAITIGSWRVDDVAAWDAIIAAFNEEYPNIEVTFDPTNPPEYNATLRTQLEGGTAWDVFFTRSFATTRQLYEEGYVEALDDLPGMDNFTAEAQAPWATDDGVPYSVPLIAVSHGIYYNQDIFDELGLVVPETWEELIAAAQVIQDAGYDPFANASGDEWTMAEIVFMNLAPNFIGGYEGRMAYLNGERCFNDEHVVAAFQAVADIAPYLPAGQEALTYYDSQQLFLLGEAAMWFGGSWDIPFFESEEPDFEWSVFAVPAPEGQDKEYVTFHMDAGMGLNAASENKEAARVFLQWLTTEEFATVLGNELPGFFPVHSKAPALTDEHAKAFLALNEGRGLDVRWAWEGLLDGEPNGYNLMQDGAIAVAAGTMTPAEAAQALQDGLAEWFGPAQTCSE